MKIWHRSQDVCAAQYQGEKSFHGLQTMSARHYMECKDTQNIANHGKDIADGDGYAVVRMVKMHSTTTTGTERRTWSAT